MGEKFEPIKEMTDPFNSAIETGVRSVAILNSIYPESADLQHLVYFDYLTLHSGDVKGPASLHGNMPLRTGELTVRRQLIENGLQLMMTRGLIDVVVKPEGFYYTATESANAFLTMLSSAYIKKLVDRAEWMANAFGDSSIDDLRMLERKFFTEWTMHFHPSREMEIQ